MPSQKLISWNVNGLRSCLGKGFLTHLSVFDADILCLQEARVDTDPLGQDCPINYHRYYNPAEKKGYSGVAIFSKREPLAVTRGMGLPEADREGRVITAEYPEYFLVNAYIPNSQRELTRLDFRTKQWDPTFLAYLKQLEQTKPVIVCGDFNCAHKEIDLANPSSNRRNAGFTDEERAGFSRLIDSGFIDTFREFEKSPGHYSWWSFRFSARERNIGWRLDYFLISLALRNRLTGASILPHVKGSDHCPVEMVLDNA
ncbi:MAG: exodeoxyribonuclease III [Verrucomicrobiota bacterium]|nr:exodeoxyribonuclease III [Verrucomicrobiota bacterium]